jgi:hypothetical protein
VDASPTVTTLYTVVGTSNGCSASDTITVNYSGGITVDSVTADVYTGCAPLTTQLHAYASGSGNYSVTSIPYSPIATPGSGVTTLANNGTVVGTLTGFSMDDGGFIDNPIPFTFNFYGVPYTSFALSCNGFIVLGAGAPNTMTGYGTSFPYAFAGAPSIGAVYADLDFRTVGTGSVINYFTVGTSPSRKLVINFINGQFYNGVAGSVVTSQIILNEGSNTVEVHTTTVNHSTATFTTQVEGIQDPSATLFTTVPGRNGTVWSVTTGDAYLFAPPSLTYSWTPTTGLSDPSIANPTASGLAAGPNNYTVTVTNSAGCSATGAVTVTPITCTSATINVRALIQGYYIGGHQMTTVMLNQAVPGATDAQVDTVIVELHDVAGTLIDSYTSVIDTGGNVTGSCSVATIGDSYYIAVRHRNAVFTVSADLVQLDPVTNYDFTTAASQAYNDNQIDVNSENIWSFYSGDYNQDEFIDVFDFPQYDNDNLALAEGYQVTDINGDGFVDVFDFPIYDNNNLLLIQSYHPW